MAVYKLTLAIQSSYLGATESYYSEDATEANLVTSIQSLINTRNNLLFANSSINEARISLQPSNADLLAERKVPRASQIIIPPEMYWQAGGKVIKIPAHGFFGGAEAVNPELAKRPDQFRAALQVAVTWGLNGSATRYIAGIMDAVSNFEPATIDTAAGGEWLKAYEKFRKEVVDNNWQIKVIAGAPTYQAEQAIGLAVKNTTGGVLGVVLPYPAVSTVLNTGKVRLSNWRRHGRGGISLNGAFYIDSVTLDPANGQRILWLRGTQGQDPNQWKVIGRVQTVRYQYLDITNMIPKRVGIHKRGRPLPAVRGRRLTRLSLDP